MTTETVQQHAPGPWRIRYNTDDYYDADAEEIANRYIASIDDAEEHTVCYTESGYFKMNEANARLIASAPDLLAALEATANYAKLLSQSRPSPDADNYWYIYTTTQAAIRRARGED